jgi:secretion/DNA translocation related TadE-like protein
VRCDRGSGAVAALGVIAASVVLVATIVPVSAALPARTALSGAADAAALAAADATTGAVRGEPCRNAELVAASARARLATCRVDGFVVTIRLERTFAGLPMHADATAGPPGTPRL